MTSIPEPNEEKRHKWELYTLLSDSIPFYHSRWVDNFRVFLLFNSFLLPASMALLGLAMKDQLWELKILVMILCVVGIAVTNVGFKLLKRINIDTSLRYAQLIYLEKEFLNLPLSPYTDGKFFFFGTEENFHRLDYEVKTESSKKDCERAIDAYEKIRNYIRICYAIIGVAGFVSLFFEKATTGKLPVYTLFNINI